MIDGKYGHVTVEHGEHIPDDEPCVVFRAQDALIPALLVVYHQLCEKAGSPRRHLALIEDTMETVENWQREHATKVPDSETSKGWMQ